MSSPYPYFIPVSPSADSSGFAHPPVVLVNSSGDPVELIEVQQSATAPPAPTGTGLNRWIETTTGIEYQWDADLERWVEVRPVMLNAFSSSNIIATGGVGIFGTLINVNTEIVLSGFRVTGQGTGTATDYYSFFPGVFPVASGTRQDLTAFAVDNRLFVDSNFYAAQRIDRQLLTISGEPTFFTVRAAKVGSAANFGNAAFALQVHRVRAATA